MRDSKKSLSDVGRQGLRPSPCLERTRLPALALAVLSAALPILAVAADQHQYLTQRVIPVPHPITSLLRSGRIHRELRLTPDIIRQVEQAADEVDRPLWRLRDLPPDKRNEQAGKLIDQLKMRLSESLTARQMDRLDQIVWQAQGIEAILEPEVATQLGLSAEQTASIFALLSGAYKRIAEVRLNTQIRSEPVKTAYIRRIQAETQQNITAVLNSAQQSAFAALIGRPIDLSQVRSVACKAPEIAAETWINSSPVSLSDLKGKVTVVHFYAFGCGNCVRSLPYYNDWLRRFDADRFAIVAIHRPETERERDVEKVKEKAAQTGMQYPIAVDNDSLAWQAWANHTWPATYLIDKNGYVRYWWYGELNWQGNE
ncbi:MAG: redoxin domain-containing protein, partial [Planctomycetota bacterium]